jgi:ABC-type lipoprotein release transport system permease subunit
VERKTITRIPAMPFALMYGAINAVIGLVMGVIFALFFVPIFTFASSQPGYTGPSLTAFGFIFGIGAIVTFPIGMFVSGLIMGLIFAGVYNFLAPRIGGIILYFQTEPKPVATQ